jgi:APA family basic amino acid/polyamine antiporter
LVAIAALSVASVGYLGFLSPAFDSNSASYNHLGTLAVEIGFVWLFTLINLIGVHTAGVVQLLLTIIKISPLIVITLIGFGSIHFDNLTQFTVGGKSSFSAFNSAAAITFWAFLGLEAATVPAENTQGPRDIFKATVFGTTVASIIYITSTFVLMGMFPLDQLTHTQFPFADAASKLFGVNVGAIMASCAVISGLGALNGCILVQGQIVFAAARDSLFPHHFAKLSKHDVPIAGQLFSGLVISLFLILTIDPVLLKHFNSTAMFASLLTLIVYFVSMLAEIKFARKTFSTTLVVALIAAAYAIWMISSFEKSQLISALVLFILAVPIYIFIVRKQITTS